MNLQPRLVVCDANPRPASILSGQLLSNQECANDLDGMSIINDFVKPREQISRLRGEAGILLWNKGLDGVETERWTSSRNVLDEIETDFPFKDADLLGGAEPGEGQEGDEEGDRIEVVANNVHFCEQKKGKGGWKGMP